MNIPPNRLLAIAYHFPPCKVSSGIQRTLKFVSYLRPAGWEATVLTASPRAYEALSDEQMGEVPEGMRVVRAWALDTRRHLAVWGRYPQVLALPDRWVSWWLGGVIGGLREIRRNRPSVIWSTYPIATAHLIAWSLHRLTGIPWVADFRDQMTEDLYPADPRVWRSYRWIERRAIVECSRAVFTTPGALRMYEDRYSDAIRGKGVVIPNGYDEENFAAAESAANRDTPESRSRLELVHSGVLYPEERDPRPFFQALARLKSDGRVSAADLRVTLRATGHDDIHREAARAAGVDDIVFFAPPLPYSEALREMLEMDGLLLFQAASCNHQIPAKVYEYFRTGRPVLSLADGAGDTAAIVREAGLDAIVPLDDVDRIEQGLEAFLQGLRENALTGASPEVTARYSRRSLSRKLAGLLDEIVAEPG